MFLTIAIPAYNRPDNLDVLLSGLVKILTDETQVYISDDASPLASEIRQVVEKYTALNPNIKYFLNEQNLGYSGNVFKLYELSDSKYIWFLCDDDVVLETSVSDIISKLKKHEPTVAVFNHTQIDPYGRKIKAFYGDHDLLFTDDAQFEDASHLFRICFLSTLVVEKLGDLPELKKTDYANNIFVQISFSFLLLSKKFKFAEFTDVVLHRNVGFKYGEFFKFYTIDTLKSIYIVDHCISTKKFKDWAIRDMPTALKLYLSQKLGLFKYWGRPTKQSIRSLFDYYGIYALAFLSFPVISFLTPTILLKALYFFQLVQIHGFEQAKVLYKEKINRAYTDSRKTGFTTYK